MIGAVIEHRHEITITADQYDTVNCFAINKTYYVHTQVQVQISFFGSAGEGFVVLCRDAITQTFYSLQEHLLVASLRTGWAVRMSTHEAAIATQEIKQLTKVYCN